jgi:hypothetical protein
MFTENNQALNLAATGGRSQASPERKANAGMQQENYPHILINTGEVINAVNVMRISILRFSQRLSADHLVLE